MALSVARLPGKWTAFLTLFSFLSIACILPGGSYTLALDGKPAAWNSADIGTGGEISPSGETLYDGHDAKATLVSAEDFASSLAWDYAAKPSFAFESWMPAPPSRPPRSSLVGARHHLL
ncbi:MAG: hypothetical protein IDH49_11135 [Gammaproteobacteria bacterium]|nr:hypothetical protein [Gammaproteobacteria bacterium]